MTQSSQMSVPNILHDFVAQKNIILGQTDIDTEPVKDRF
jgi:hypothetical protein